MVYIVDEIRPSLSLSWSKILFHPQHTSKILMFICCFDYFLQKG